MIDSNKKRNLKLFSEFLFDSNKLKLLDENEVMRCYVNSANKFSHNNVADVDFILCSLTTI